MDVPVYADYTRARIGFFFGLTGPQLALVAGGALPVLWALSDGRWAAAGTWLLVWGLACVLVLTPVRGRSAFGWLSATTAHTTGRVTGWSRFTARAARGTGDRSAADLPGVLAGVEIHEAPPTGPTRTRVALVQHHTARTWAVTAAVTHPGIGMSEPAQRDRHAAGLSALLDAACATELVDEVIVMVRTVPEDGAERDAWTARHRTSGGPATARMVNDELHAWLSPASVRTETFVTVVVPESRLSRPAREAGGGLAGRARALAGVAGEVEAHLRGGLGCTQVRWLPSPELAVACRTGFAPGDRAGLVDARHAHEVDPSVNADVPWGHAGPSGARTAARHYRHDAWCSVSATLALPVKGAVLGALAPVLVPGAGERRSFVVVYPVVPSRAADRSTAGTQWRADMADGLRTKAKVRQSARAADETARARGLDRKLARGHALTTPYAVVTTTVPATGEVSEHGRRLEASIRAAGFAPLRLDLSQDAAFAASTIPLGASLTRRGST